MREVAIHRKTEAALQGRLNSVYERYRTRHSLLERMRAVGLHSTANHRSLMYLERKQPMEQSSLLKVFITTTNASCSESGEELGMDHASQNKSALCLSCADLEHLSFPMSWQERIVTDPGILVGKPVVRGTRLAVEFIPDLMAQGWSEPEILRNYPGLTREDV